VAVKTHRAEDHEDEHDAQAEAEVADAIDEEGFFGRLARGWLIVVVADEQVGAEADAFPAEIEQDEVVGHDQDGHGEYEEAEVGEEAEIAAFAFHVAGGED